MKKIMRIAVIFALLILPFGKLFTVNAVTPANGISKNILNPNPDTGASVEGIELYTLFEGTNIETGQLEKSSKSGINIGNDMIDVSRLTNIKQIAEISNTGTDSQSINIVWILPKYYRVYTNTNTVVSDEVLITGTNNLNVTYSAIGGEYIPKTSYLSSYSWNDLIAMQMTGMLAPGENIRLEAPLYVPAQSGSFGASLMMFNPEYNTWSIDLTHSNFIANVDDYMFGKFAGAYRTEENGVLEYRQVPREIQEILPDVESRDFIYSRWRELYTPGIQANFDELSSAAENKIYSNSQYLIKIERIFEAVKDHGFSVMADDARGLWNAYAYGPVTLRNFRDQDGNTVELGREDANSILLSNYYVELHKILDTEDIVINVGEPWDEYDNLTYKKDIYPVGGPQSRELEFSEIGTEHNVNNMLAGEYFVKYSYEVATGKFVTKTAKVTVVGADIPGEPDDDIATDSNTDRPDIATDSNTDRPDMATDSNTNRPDTERDTNIDIPKTATNSDTDKLDILPDNKPNVGGASGSSSSAYSSKAINDIQEIIPIKLDIYDNNKVEEQVDNISNIPKTSDNIENKYLYILLGSIAFMSCMYIINRKDNLDI